MNITKIFYIVSLAFIFANFSYASTIKTNFYKNKTANKKSNFSSTKKAKKIPVDVKSFTLKNGLQVILIPNHRAPVVNHTIWYKIGSADSPYNKSGLAHFLEHLMYKGTQKYPHDEYKKIINKLGGIQNAYTSYDNTMYYVTIAKEFLPKIMELEADRMVNLIFNKEIVEKEKQVVIQERRENVDANPFRKIGEAANATFFWHHPYGKPLIGFMHHIESYTLEDAKSFYNTWYCPNNAILVITGDIDLKTVKTLANKYYGQIKEKKLPSRARTKEPPHHNIKNKVELRDQQVNGIYIQRIYNAPNYRTSSMKEATSLAVLSHILGDNTSGRLHKALVEQLGVAHSATTSYNGSYLDPYSFTITSVPVNATDLAFLETAVEYEVLRLISGGISKRELENSKKELQYAFRYEHDSLTSISEYIGNNVANGISLKDTLSWLDIIENVTIQDVNEVARKYLKKGPLVTLYTYPISYN